MAKRLLLKVFSGPHLGAEAVLSDGEYTLGRGLHCDLVFEDHAVAEEHLRLKVTGDKVHAQPLGDSRMLIGGKPTDGCTLPPGEYFTVGTTHLAIGFTDEQWVLKPLPELKLGDDAAPVSRTPEPEKASTPTPPRKSRKKRVFAAVLLTSLIAVGAWGAWMALTPSVQAGESLPDGTGAALAALIAKHGVGDTVKTEKTERGWIVEGHLQDRESLKALEMDCRAHIPASAIRLWDSETLANAAGVVLAEFRLPVAAAPGAPGEVIFQGRVPETAQWSRVRERIVHDVPKLLKLTDNVLTGSGKLLRDSRGRSVDAATAPPPPSSYVLAIKYPNKEGSDGKKSGNDIESKPVAKLESKSPEPLKTPTNTEASSKSNIMYATATPAPSTTAAVISEKVAPPVLAYQSVSVGSTSWLRLADGTRVSVGGRIGGGYEVTSISDEAIEARKGESKVVYRLKEGG